MALTRPFLKSLGIESDKIDAIVEGHSETVNGLKGEIETLHTQLDALKPVESERDQLKTRLEKADKEIATLKDKTSNSESVISERDALKTEVESLKVNLEQFTKERETKEAELNTLKEQLATFETDKATLTQERDTAKSEFEAYKTKIETERTNTAKRDAVRNALRNGGVERSDFQDLIINSMNLDDIKVSEDGIEEADKFIESTKSKYPSCFGTVQEGGTPPVNPPSGNPPRSLTMAQIEKMSPDEINANWDAVQQTLSKQGV